MINWFREKIGLTEKRTRWRKQSPVVERDQTTNNTEKKPKLYGKNSSDESILPKVSLKIINPRGGICTVFVSLDASGLEIKKEALRKLSDCSHFSLDGGNSSILEKYKLIRAKSQRTLDDKDKVDEMKIVENEEFVLVAQRTDQLILKSENHKGPTEGEILEATANVTVQFVRRSPVNQINNVFMQTELQYDFRKILIALLKYSAYLIGGSDAQADKLIEYYRQKLRFKPSTFETTMDLFPEQIAKRKTNIETLLQIVQICSQSFNKMNRNSIFNLGLDEQEEDDVSMTRTNRIDTGELMLDTMNELSNDLVTVIHLLLQQPQIQYSLGNPKMFITYISILENYWTLNSYLNDTETSSVITHILRIYHEEKHILAINQSNIELT